jgi:hypothetical protein
MHDDRPHCNVAGHCDGHCQVKEFWRFLLYVFSSISSDSWPVLCPSLLPYLKLEISPVSPGRQAFEEVQKAREQESSQFAQL